MIKPKEIVEPLIENASPIVSPVVSPSSKSQESSPSKPTMVQENFSKEIRHRTLLRSRSRSRSRSFEKSAVRSRSRDRRMNEREKIGRHYRNKSPPADRRRYDRRQDRSPKPFGRPAVVRSLSKSRSRSPERRKISRSISPTGDDSIASKQKRQRCRDFDGESV